MIQHVVRATACTLVALCAPALALSDSESGNAGLHEDLQAQFADAYNRKDADAMAAFFAEDGVRVTPNGIFQGREAIRRSLQIALTLGLRDYTVRRIVVHDEGEFSYHAGEWQAKLGDHQLHGYYSALIRREGGQAYIVEETVNVAAPARP